MFKKKTAIALGLAMLAGSSTAWAGKTGSYYPVVINSTANVIAGSFGSVRNSPDTVQSLDIGFQVGNGFYYAYIYAYDATGTMASCTTYNRDMIEVIKSASPDSYIMAYHDGAGTCTNIEMRTASYLDPK
ncbi:hypothetical protein D7Y27_14030 [Corallococcus sp. AB004]|uniref:hypothetical protein n=1 Tax=Corallococcus TaxID=83461 RepID=UPI000EA188D4|nr:MULTISPECIES: hypothetical protein [Corallococcus]NPC69371.1 hypothetical protein [Corallococcus exiguus]NPD24122.1 hypothetical protein [Corallococcus exiguus]RKI05205.1 hypothetical protein D7Y04_10215 [Corallococcus sp. AB038B]RKI44199.1 hypothetical protein D7Y27_14030 [Corallococcus sp. AB004]